MNQTLRQVRYQELKRSGRGLVRRYVSKTTGLSRAQSTRLLSLYLKGEEVKPKPYRRHGFRKRYTHEDVELLATVDEAHGTLSGPATQKILQRAAYDFEDAQYERLAKLSVAQLYRLRQTRPYRQRRVSYQTTRPTPVSIGERRRPEPNGRPGYLRVDTVHQGDWDQRRVPHQCGGRSDAVAVRGGHRADQRGLPAAGVWCAQRGEHAGARQVGRGNGENSARDCDHLNG